MFFNSNKRIKELELFNSLLQSRMTILGESLLSVLTRLKTLEDRHAKVMKALHLEIDQGQVIETRKH